MEEASGWTKQEDDADSWMSVGSASWKALRGAEKEHRVKDRDNREIFLRKKLLDWRKGLVLKEYIRDGDEDCFSINFI